MGRELRGVVKGGVIVLEGEERVPEGTKVPIVVEQQTPRKSTNCEAIQGQTGHIFRVRY